MKRIVLLLLACAFSSILSAQRINKVVNSRIYIVRHAEKETGKDPGLTTAGRQRAGDLMRKLKNKHIRRIYVTEYRRTQMTADSLRIQLGIDTLHYPAGDTTLVDLMSMIAQHGDHRKTILVIGHSNTIPNMLRKLGVLNFPPENIADEEFDNLFLVRTKNHKIKLTKYKYGAASSTSAPMKSSQ